MAGRGQKGQCIKQFLGAAISWDAIPPQTKPDGRPAGGLFRLHWILREALLPQIQSPCIRHKSKRANKFHWKCFPFARHDCHRHNHCRHSKERWTRAARKRRGQGKKILAQANILKHEFEAAQNGRFFPMGFPGGRPNDNFSLSRPHGMCFFCFFIC